jgi:hypothetical protein
MFTNFENLKSLARGAALALLPLIAACGGGGDDPPEKETSGPGLITCIVVTLATGENVCQKSSSSEPTSTTQTGMSASQSGQIPVSSSNSGPALQGNQEFESNDELANANLPASAARSTADTQTGWYVAGSIDDMSDTRDAFAFTPNRTSEYAIALCPPEGSSCDESAEIDTLTAFFRVLDQDGKVLLTSQADTEKGNRHQMNFDAGVIYYVTVDAGDTMGVTVDYRLFVFEN